VPDAPVEDVLRSSVGIKTEGYTHQSSFYYPLRGGFQAISDGIGAPLLPRVRLSTPVRELVRTKSGWKVNGEEFDLAVSTLALTDLPGLVAGMPDEVARAMRTLQYNGMVSILLGLERREHPDLSWIYLPHAVQGPANRVTFMSNYSPHNAPKGKSSFLCEVTLPGGQRFPGAELEGQVIAGMAAAGLLRRDEVLLTDRSEVRHAYVVFDQDYAARRAAIFAWMSSVDLVPLGRFGRFEYDNSDQCVIRSRALAEELLPRLLKGH
jgi:protoporphyrinogen oxidase